MLSVVQTQDHRLSSAAQQLIAERIDPKATLFEEHGSFFVGVDQQPGRLVIGWGETIEEAVTDAIENYEG